MGLMIRLSATVGVADALDMVGDTYVAATVAFGYRVPCFVGGSHDVPSSFASGSIGGKQFDVRDAFIGNIEGFLRRRLFGAGWRTSLFGLSRFGRVACGSSEATQDGTTVETPACGKVWGKRRQVAIGQG
jgi:hypothetical protein